MCEGIRSDIKLNAPHPQTLEDTYKIFWNPVYLDGGGKEKEKYKTLKCSC